MAGYVFRSGGVSIELGDVDADRRVGVAASGFSAPLDAHEVPQANDARVRAVAEAVAGARARMGEELDRLAKARFTHAEATRENEAARADLDRAKHAHRAAVQRAESPTASRQALTAAETRASDGATWQVNSARRLTEVEQSVRAAAAAAWREEVEARRPAADAEKAKFAKAAAELLSDLARLALAALPIDSVILGTEPTEQLLATDEPEQQQPAGLRLAAG